MSAFDKVLKAGLFAAAICFGATAAHAVPMSVSLNTVSSSDGDINVFGGPNVDTTDFIVSVQSSGGNETFGILEFDLSSIPDTAVITSARLRLETFGLITNVGNADVTVDYIAYAGDGIVALGDESIAGTNVASEIYSSGTVGNGGTPANSLLDINFSTLVPVEDAVSGATSDFLGIRLDTINFATFRVYSSDNAGGFLVPTLEVNFDAEAVSEPGALGLFVMAVAAAGFIRRRQAHRT